jgi:hypothetical protein
MPNFEACFRMFLSNIPIIGEKVRIFCSRIPMAGQKFPIIEAKT